MNADNYAPVFESVKLDGNGTESHYSKKAKIYVDVKDEFESPVNMVSMRLLDEDGSIISDWGSSVRSGITYSKTFDVVAEANGKKVLTLEAKDLAGHVISRQVEIKYLDSKSPTMISDKVSSQEWSKSKRIIFSCTDEGVGNVEIAFNDLSDFKIADYSNGIYSRAYSFIGDAYGEVTGAVYFRDGAGNITTEFVKIYNLDNTNPEIESVSVDDAFDVNGTVNGWNISVSGNDNNANLDKEGGGIIGYAITKDDMAPEESLYEGESSIFIPKSGTYYVWIKDAAGNVRHSQAITIHPDIFFNGIPISNSELNGKKIRDVYFNGKRLRL